MKSIDFSKDIEGNKFLLVLLQEDSYSNKLYNIVEKIDSMGMKICYLCLNKPYSDVVSDLKNVVNTDKMFFIDVLTSYYKRV